MDNSVVSKQPDNVSLLNTNKYSLTFPSLPHINFFIYSVILPGVSTNSAQVGTPFTITKRHGDTLIYDPLTITVVADENLKSWIEAYDWLVGLTFPTKFKEYIGHYSLDTQKFPRQTLYSDAALIVRSNASNPNLLFKFKDCHPIALSSIAFNNADNAEITPYFDVTFDYDYFTVERFNT